MLQRFRDQGRRIGQGAVHIPEQTGGHFVHRGELLFTLNDVHFVDAAMDIAEDIGRFAGRVEAVGEERRLVRRDDQ